MTPELPPPWTLAAAHADRAKRLLVFGFTERQARFLALVLQHTGVFVERQYYAFAGIAHGQKTHNFIQRLIDRSRVRRAHSRRPCAPRSDHPGASPGAV